MGLAVFFRSLTFRKMRPLCESIPGENENWPNRLQYRLFRMACGQRPRKAASTDAQARPLGVMPERA